ncbi:hypothetical protein [Georgenia sp. SYP-B2076]|uniref:hypothetical protein n=1 Tax=Georgenia sp. SYP-B2076 TaxID=2495881 RepID=UPI000F8D596E|nr:hypothetical protein [Georgenia sp. SYP-B2076]
MELTSLLGPRSRVIDVGADGPDVARWLAGRGHERYLGLVPPDRLEAVREAAGDLADRFVALDPPSLATRNSADLMIVRRPFAAYLWSFRDLRHVRYLAVEAGGGVRGVEAHLAGLVPRLTGRAAPRGRCTCAGRQLDVLELAGRPAPRARRYLSPTWGVTGLVQRLEAHGVRYAALRWFEQLPALDPGEDLDLLVADDDLATVERLLAEEPGTIPVDLYSESGLTGTDYQGMAYYPPALARQILDRAVVHPSGCRVPRPLDHLRSLAYHAAYHKGLRSGLASAMTTEREPNPEHDYAAVLADLARENGVDLTLTLDGVDEYLADQGWRPPPDTLRRLAASNPWVGRRFPAEAPPPDPPEPAVFLVRERTLDVVRLDEVRDVLVRLGFEILLVRALDGPARARCADQMRGGNWGRGPFPQSGGVPATAIVALHYGPRLPPAHLRERYPRLSNIDSLQAKLRIRDLVAERVPEPARFNPVHSSDDETEAWEYVDLAVPDEAGRLRAEVRRRRAEYATDVPVERVLSRGRRAKVEVVRTEHGRAVRKTFVPAARRHLERELGGLATLAPHVAVPEVLATGPNWFLSPYYENRLRRVGDRPGGALVPLRAAREMVDVLRRVHALGLDLVDAKPQNFLLDPERGLTLVDLEFLQRYEGEPPPFTGLYGFVGVPDGFGGDVPFVDDLRYDLRWRPYVGLSMEALLGSPPWEQHLRRAAFRLARVAGGSSEPVRRVGGRSLRTMRRARRRAAGLYHAWARRRALRPMGDAT